MRLQSLRAKGSLTPTRLYLIRHGQVADGHTHLYHGNNDIDLSRQGIKQLEDLAAQLRPIALAAVYTSDLKRAYEGAEILCRALPRLKEILSQHQGQSLAMVTHAGINRVILCEALGLPLKNLFNLDQKYGCLNIIDYFPDLAVVRLVNGGVNGF